MLFLSLLVVLPAGATTYYVDASLGNDANNGTTVGAPWATIARVNATKLNPGDTVLFKRGQLWREQLTNASSGSLVASITYADYGTGNKPSIRGSDTYSTSGSWTNETGNLWFVSFIVKDPGVFAHDGLLGTRQTLKTSVRAQWDYWYDAADARLYVYSVGNPAGLAIQLEIAVRPSFWSQSGIGYINFVNLDLRHYTNTVWFSFASITVNFTGVDISQTASYGVQFNNGGSGTVSGCTFTDWGVVDGQQYAIHVIGYNGKPSGPVDVIGSVFTINHSMNMTELGAVVSDDNGWTRNVFNNAAINNGNWPGSAFWLWRPQGGATSINYQGNATYSVGSFGIGVQELEFYGATPTTTISYNFIQDSDQSDVLDTEALRVRDFSISSPVVVSYNVINRTRAGASAHPGIYLYGANNTRVYGNTIVGTDQGILLKFASTNNDIRNNISSFNRVYGITVQDTSTATSFNNNLFSSNGSGNYSGISAGAGDVTNDPEFTDRAENLLTITTSSSAATAGANLGSPHEVVLMTGSVWPGSILKGTQNASGIGWAIGAFIGTPNVIPPAPTSLSVTDVK
jgi:parallel beta-helix repeat protein